MTEKTLDAVTTDVSGSTITIHESGRHRDNATVQVLISGGTVTVTIQGSCDGTNWVDIDTFTSSGGKLVGLFPFMRCKTTSTSGATTTAWIHY